MAEQRNSISHQTEGTQYIDRVVEVLGVRDRCLSWGNARRRLDNLDALRAHATTFTEQADGQTSGSTSAGLITWLEKLGNNELDKQAVLPGEDAVTVSTWHGAKGCEWPITILGELERNRDRTTLDVAVVSDHEDIDMSNPLANRWIRYWPNPYSARTRRTPFHDRLAERSAEKAVKERGFRERLRLLYVIWTRARDRLILVTRTGIKLDAGTLGLLRDENGKALLSDLEEEKLHWLGHDLDVQVRDLKPAETLEQEREPGAWYERPPEIPEHPFRLWGRVYEVPRSLWLGISHRALATLDSD